MDVILLATILCASYMVLLYKIIGLRMIIRFRVIFDLFFTIGVPFMFYGTFHGMATAIIAGLMFTVVTEIVYIIKKSLNHATQ